MFNEKEIKWAVKKLYEMFDEDDRAEVEELMEMEIEDFFPDLAAALYQKSLDNEKKGHIKILSHARVVRGNLHYDHKDQVR